MLLSSRLSSIAKALACVSAAAVLSVPAYAANGLTAGAVELQSIGPMTFAEDSVLLIGDPKAAAVYAVAIETDSTQAAPQNIADIRGAVATAIGASSDDTRIGDMAIDQATKTIVLSAQVGDEIHLVQVLSDGSAKEIDLATIEHAKKALPNPPADQGQGRRNRRMQSITDLAFFNGKVLVSGMSAGDSPSSVLEFPFPFAENSVVTNVQIYHANHDRVEEPAISQFVPMTINGEATLLAGFTCTPLVRFPIGDLDGGELVRGTTVAELGNRNRPLDMIAYTKDGVENILMSNSARGVMKISTENIGTNPGLTTRAAGTAGQTYETIDSLEGVAQMSQLSDSQVVVVIGQPGQAQKLEIVDLP